MHLERERESSKQKTFTISNIFFRTYSKDTKKVKNKQLKKKSQLIYKGKHSTLNVSNQERMELDKDSHSTSNLSKKTLKSSKEWNGIFQVLKANNFQIRLLCPTKLSFRTVEKFDYFKTNKQHQGC